MRQLTNCSRALCLATLARRVPKQLEDVPAALAAPSARLLLAARASSSAAPAPAPAEDTTCLRAPSQQSQHILHDTGNQVDASPGAAWRGFAASPGDDRASAAKAVLYPDRSSEESSEHGKVATSPLIWAPPPFRPSHLERPPAMPSTSRAGPSGGASVSPRPKHGSIHAPNPAFPSASTFASAFSYSGTYNEPKDGSFSGRIVQHDGSRAVHLLVSGTGVRDYNLRMVRCHARDELVLGGPPAGAACSTTGGAAAHGPVPRGEDVAFTTFMYRQVRDTITATFLPSGYPDTTGQNYVQFMVWQGVNNIAVTANSVLASTFMLYAVGLGAGSIPTAGALNWVLKDGMGQLGTLLFGKTIAHNFDVHSKTWFFLSALMLQAAAALELMTVLAPSHFLLMGSLANTLKGLAWMAAGSTRSVFHLSYARDNNIADVTAKGTSQYIFASLVGTAGGAVMCAAVGQSGAVAMTCFALLAAATIGSAYMAVEAIPLATLNATRLQLLVDAFLTSISPKEEARRRGGGEGNGDGSTAARNENDEEDYDEEGEGIGGGGGGGRNASTVNRRWSRPQVYRTVDRCYVGPSTHEYEMMYDDSLEPRVPTPLELSPRDPPLPYFSRTADSLSPPITVGSRLEHVVDGNANLLVMLLSTYKYSHFMVLPRKGGLHVVLHERADPRDMVQAYLQACILRRRLRSEKSLGLARELVDDPPYELRWLAQHARKESILHCITDTAQSAEDILGPDVCGPADHQLSDDQHGVVLALHGLLACNLLQHCLQKRHRVDYGVARHGLDRKRMVVPFRAAHTPSERSEFAQPDVALLLTNLSYYYDGLFTAGVPYGAAHAAGHWPQRAAGLLQRVAAALAERHQRSGPGAV